MAKSASDDQLVENQVVFRKSNKQVSETFAKFKSIGEQTGDDLDANILFFCECSDEKCKQRVEMKQSTYDQLHSNDNRFIILPGHNIPTIERIIQKGNAYLIVEKYSEPPAENRVGELNKTDLDFYDKAA